MSRLSVELHDHIGQRSVQQVADEWRVPYWVLRDTLRGTVQCPGPRYLPNISKGMGRPIEEIIEAAYDAVAVAS